MTLPIQTSTRWILAVAALVCLPVLWGPGVSGDATRQGPSNVGEHQVKSASQRPLDMPLETSRPYFQMSDQERKSLIDNVKKVRLGDKRQQVEALLGKPSEDYLVRRKENNKPLGRFVKYYVLKLSKNLANDKYDQDVLFRFDNNDSLQKIISHVAGIENRP